MEDLTTYLEYLYNSFYIPIYIYQNRELTATYPAQNDAIFPPASYLEKLWNTDKVISLALTAFHAYYARVKIDNSDISIVLGPVSSIPYLRQMLSDMRLEYCPEPFHPENFSLFFNNIPSHSLNTFINILLLVNFNLNHTKLTMADIVDDIEFSANVSLKKIFTETTYTVKEEGLAYNNYLGESELLHYIETGNLEKVRAFSKNPPKTQIDTIGNTSLRHHKNIFITTVTLVSRAAMKGGLSPDIAYPLSNVYYNQVEHLTDIDSIHALIVELQYDFTARVADSIAPLNKNNQLYQILKYVRENTNKNITVRDVADRVGFSYSYLSRLAKKELGFNLSDFIVRCKLEESKNLLAFSQKSISEISTYLCFSSQSHFQRLFKKQYGITPYAYRKSVVTFDS